ncbi:hypothetical protein K2Z84_19690 [Candidatus Binatia bacterium]|nr:hypothetical protein [Candidatus Binatia bacterium]
MQIRRYATTWLLAALATITPAGRSRWTVSSAFRRGDGARWRVVASLVVAWGVTLLAPAAARAAWQEIVGGPSPITHDAAIEAVNPSIADVDGTLYVAWEAHPSATESDVHVSKLDGAGADWVDVGGALSHAPTDNAFRPHVAAIGGVPWVAWIEYDGTSQKVRVAKLNEAGTGWSEVVGGANPINHDATQNAYDPCLADVGGVPYVAWAEQPEPNVAEARIRVSRLNDAGTAWTEVVGGSNPINHDASAQAGGPSLTSIGGVPFVAWQEGYGDPKIHVSKLNDAGTAWVELGSGPAPVNHDPDKYAASPSLTGIGGVPWVAWSEADEFSFQIRVARLNEAGTGWTEVVGGAQPINLPGGGAGQHPSLTSIDGVPYVAFSQYDNNEEIRVKRLDDAGTAWIEVDGGASPINETPFLDGITPSLTVSGGVPVVAWAQAEEASPMQIRVSRDVPPTSGIPDTVITSGPTSSISAFATFEFAAIPPADATFECALDGLDFEPCTSPYTSPALDAGDHVFSVRASNAFGTDPTPASRLLVVDQTPPVAQLRLSGTTAASGAYLTGVVVNLDVTDAAPSSGIRNRFCVVDPPAPPTSFGAFGSQPCGGTVTASGNHVVYGIANDQAGNESEIVNRTFRILPLPDTTITNGPTAVSSSAPLFEFTSTPPGANFECRVDAGTFQRCTSPYVAYNLPLGAHTLYVRAVTLDGATDPTPATYAFTLAARSVRSSCSFLVPYLTSFDIFKPTPFQCTLVRDFCPVRSLCTAEDGVLAEDGDVQAAIAGAVYFQYPKQVPFYFLSTGCWSDVSISSERPAPACPWVGSSSLIGRGEPITISCTLADTATGLMPVQGPDPDRRITCEAVYTVRPVASLDTTVAGPLLNVFAPGAGTLVVSPGTGALTASALAAGAAPKPPFRTVKKKVKKEGPVAVRIGLSPALAKQLRTAGEVTVAVDLTFTPADGGAVQVRSEDVTLIKVKKGRKAPRR